MTIKKLEINSETLAYCPPIPKKGQDFGHKSNIVTIGLGFHIPDKKPIVYEFFYRLKLI